MADAIISLQSLNSHSPPFYFALHRLKPRAKIKLSRKWASAQFKHLQ